MFSHTQGRRAARTTNPSANSPPSFSRLLLSAPTTGIPGATSRLLTAPLTILPHSQTDCFKINELTSEFLPTGQLTGLPKQHYLLRPDPPPPTPPLPARPSPPLPGTAAGSLRRSRLLSFGPNPAQRHLCPGTGAAAPTHVLPAQSPLSGLQRRVRLPSAGRGVSTGATRAPPAAPAPGRGGGALQPGTHPGGEGRRRRRGRQRPQGLALCPQGSSRLHFSRRTTMGANASPPSSAPSWGHRAAPTGRILVHRAQEDLGAGLEGSWAPPRSPSCRQRCC